MSFRILCIGNQWRGSDDGSLFRAFARAGHLISIVDDMMFIPWSTDSIAGKTIRTIGTRYLQKNYNDHIKRQTKIFKPDLVCVYKGTSVFSETLSYIKTQGAPIVCIYPDVSMFDHGKHIPECIPLYDYIFTTKSFGIQDLRKHFQYVNASVIRHCVDPEIHRPIDQTLLGKTDFRCDVSFIGTYSPKKEGLLKELLKLRPELDLKIWGGYWHTSRNEKILRAWQNMVILGDIYALAINASCINLSILSEAGGKASSGDLITARTFHIPGAGGFMLHERTPEVLEIFQEGKEVECFDSIEELVEKIGFYLVHNDARVRIAQEGHQKIMSAHTSDHRVAEIIETLTAIGILSAVGS